LPSCSVNPWYVRGDNPVAPEPRLSCARYLTVRSDCLEKYEWDQSVGLGLESPRYRDEPAITVLSGRPMADPLPPDIPSPVTVIPSEAEESRALLSCG
jgi:hypothetical protein